MHGRCENGRRCNLLRSISQVGDNGGDGGMVVGWYRSEPFLTRMREEATFMCPKHVKVFAYTVPMSSTGEVALLSCMHTVNYLLAVQVGQQGGGARNPPAGALLSLVGSSRLGGVLFIRQYGDTTSSFAFRRDVKIICRAPSPSLSPTWLTDSNKSNPVP